MALSDFIKKNSYTVIDNVNMNKRNKSIYFNLICYSDKSKSNVLMEQNFQFEFNNKVTFIKNVNSKELISDSDEYFVINENIIYKKIENLKLDKFGKVSDKIIIYETSNIYPVINTNNKYYKLINDKYVEYNGNDTEIYWNENFLNSSDNLYKIIYCFCKTLDLFQGTEEC